MYKRILLMFLACITCLSIISTAVEEPTDGFKNFQKVNSYPDGKFTDVAEDAWYYQDVKTAYELNLMGGTAARTFQPDKNLTVAEALKLAACLHSVYQSGFANFEASSPWYRTYADYGLSHGIITNDKINYDAPASRAQLASIFASALPDDALSQQNAVEDLSIPDVFKGSSSYDAVYKLYRAGILTGVDSSGIFRPGNTIKRSEIAAVITRMALPEKRKSFSLQYIPTTQLSISPTEVTLKRGQSMALNLTLVPQNATCRLANWSTSNPKVVTVQGGALNAVGPGNAVITAAMADGKTATCSVTVTAPLAFQTIDEFNEYLYQNHSVIHTNLGDIRIGWKTPMGDHYMYSGVYAKENGTIGRNYDYIIYTMWNKLLRSQYYDILGSSQYTDAQKTEFTECFKWYQYKLATDIIDKMPGIKLRGGFFSEGYKYPHLKEEYWCSVTLGWKNYVKNPSGEGTVLDEFTWCEFEGKYD